MFGGIEMKKKTFYKIIIGLSFLIIYVMFIIDYGFIIGTIGVTLLALIGFLVIRFLEFIETKLKD
jgi:hypothetical protein